jgi:hypothetical protein
MLRERTAACLSGERNASKPRAAGEAHSTYRRACVKALGGGQGNLLETGALSNTV